MQVKEVQVERVIVPWRQLQFPIPWTEQFQKMDVPLHLEVGFGDGRYTVRRALEDPEDCFVGLEISSGSLLRGLKNIKRHQLRNVRLLKLGAQFAVRHLFAPDSLTSITVNFPDPWPKERHEKNRLLRQAFFELAASRLKTGGAILLATDHLDYLAFASQEGLASGLYDLEEAEPPAAVFETKYALKWKSQGKPLYYQVFRFTGAPTADFAILEREAEMPHSILTGTLPDKLNFEKQVVPYGEGHVILHELAQSLGSNDSSPRWLLRVTVDEVDFKQQLLVSIKRRSDNELIVQIESFGDPIITQTVRGAIHATTEWLLTLPANIRVLTRSY